MPIYEYQCQACNHALEALQKLSDQPLSDCPACGRAELRKLVSAAGFRLKGGGWYETDFKSKGKKNLADSGKSENSTSSDGGASAGSTSTSTSSSAPAAAAAD